HASGGGGDHGGVEEVAVGVNAVEEQVVVLAGEAAWGGAAEAVGPDQVVDEAVGAEELVEEEAGVVAGAPVQVEEEARGGGELGEGGPEAAAQPGDPVAGVRPCV